MCWSRTKQSSPSFYQTETCLKNCVKQEKLTNEVEEIKIIETKYLCSMFVLLTSITIPTTSTSP